MDHLHPHPLLLLAPRPLGLRMHPRHGVDHRQPRPFRDHLSLLSLEEGTPFADDQGIYNRLTWWEQMDNGKQLTRNRKFLTVVPVVLYLIASHTTDYQHPMLFLNTLAVIVLVVANYLTCTRFVFSE
uniref:ORM1-like protein 3 n=1 Tax=Ananas comosus var. bracteatus TaxID=296719 RepID=A0A6V7QV40_ANACO